MKQEMKKEAITLREQGNTYSEILRRIPVAKSTLSLWLRSVRMSKKQAQSYTEKKRLAGLRGGAARKNERITRMNQILTTASDEIDDISSRELWLMGIMLYWAEGTKEKPWRTGAKVQLTNSDPRMIVLFIVWLKRCLEIPKDMIEIDLYIHDSQKINLEEHKFFWVSALGNQYSTIRHIYFKRSAIKSLRKNVNTTYHGLLRVNVKQSIDLNRRISGWVDGIYKRCPVV